jgi:hypothetical protein
MKIAPHPLGISSTPFSTSRAEGRYFSFRSGYYLALKVRTHFDCLEVTAQKAKNTWRVVLHQDEKRSLAFSTSLSSDDLRHIVSNHIMSESGSYREVVEWAWDWEWDGKPTPSPKPLRTGTRMGFVYFIQAQGKESSLIKIGFSHSPRLRLSSIRSDSPLPVALVGAVPAPSTTEGILHTRFASLRSHGEWFHPGPSLLSTIRALPPKKWGQPRIQYAPLKEIS